MTQSVVPFLVQFARCADPPAADAFETGPDGMLRMPGSPRPALEELTQAGANGLATMETKAAPDQPDPDVIRAARMRSLRAIEQLATKVVTVIPDPDVIRLRHCERHPFDR